MNAASMPAVLLDQSFYARCPRIVARELIGKVFVSTIGNQRSAGIIVETEAYLSTNDSACHGFRGKTAKNSAMFGAPGRAYVYPIHAKNCFNTVTETPGQPSAVLIRAIEPIDGIAVMKSRRDKEKLQDLCTGPAKLCQALGIGQAVNGTDLTKRKELWLQGGNRFIARSSIRTTVRIGVTSAQELKLRYVVADSPFASGPKYLR